jgi:hypothetical protein
MQRFMKTSSKPFEITFSPEIEKQIKDLLSRVAKFKTEVDSILTEYRPPTTVEKPSRVIESLFERFHSVALEINRRHDNRNSLVINDEYDVQDLLRGLLMLHFDDIRDEEYTPSYGGFCARMDLLLRNEQIVIETKMVRKGLSQKKIRDELIIDKAHYKVHPKCKKLYCLVYDPEEKTKNPRGFERDLSDRVDGFETKVFIMPRRI